MPTAVAAFKFNGSRGITSYSVDIARSKVGLCATPTAQRLRKGISKKQSTFRFETRLPELARYPI
jgi:hypothetical protein